jgi:hypothetical protein
MYVFYEYATFLALVMLAATLLFAASTACLIAKEGIAAVVRVSRRTSQTRTRGRCGRMYWRWSARLRSKFAGMRSK